jgi:hypothetical protein
MWTNCLTNAEADKSSCSTSVDTSTELKRVSRASITTTCGTHVQRRVQADEVGGADLVHVMPAYAEDDPERARHLVRDWIDGGMQKGDLSA